MRTVARHLARVVLGPSENHFRRLWFSLAVTMFGTWAGAVALSVRLYDQTGSPTYASLLYVAEFAPVVLIGVLSGRLLDRLPPVRALAVLEVVAGAMWLLLVFVDRPPLVIALAFVTGACAGAYKILATSAVSLLVRDDDLAAANAATLSIDNITTTLGFAAGGALLGFAAPEFVIGLNAATFAFSALLLVTVPYLRAPLDAATLAAQPFRDRMTLGARRMWQNPRLRVVLLSLPIATAGIGAANSLEVPYLRGTAGFSPTLIGVALAGAACGLVLGAWVAPFLPATTNTYIVAMAVMGVSWAVVAMTVMPAPIIAANLASGVANGVAIIRFRTTMQEETLPAERASTIGFIYALAFGLGVAGAAVAGPIGSQIGVREGLLLGAGLFAVTAVVALAAHVATRAAGPVLADDGAGARVDASR